MAMDDQGNQMPELTERDMERIAELMEQKLNRFIDRDRHQADHDWTTSKREAENRNRKSYRRIIENVVGALGTVGFIGLMGWVGHAMITFLVTMAERGGPP